MMLRGHNAKLAAAQAAAGTLSLIVIPLNNTTSKTNEVIMGSFFSLGLKPEGKGSGIRNLDVGLNRQASNVMEALFDEALQAELPAIHEKIMETLPLDQINFDELLPTDFNIAINAIRNCLAGRAQPKDWQVWQKQLWVEHFEPLVKQDFRYEG